jgi:crossover junction endodeoxyribonuclease RuvC
MKRTNNKNQIILALDLSLTSTGYCKLLFDSGSKYDYDIGLIKTNLKGVARLNYVESKIFALLLTYNRLNLLVILEGYSFGSRGRATFSSGELGGIVRLLLFKNNIKTLIAPPTSLKKFITGKGNAPKSDMKMKTLAKYDIEFTDDNECDAFGLAMMGKAYLNGTNIKYEQEALKGIDVMG